MTTDEPVFNADGTTNRNRSDNHGYCVVCRTSHVHRAVNPGDRCEQVDALAAWDADPEEENR
jgi:hypothetical protein